MHTNPKYSRMRRRGLAKARHAPSQARVFGLVDGWREMALGRCSCLATALYCFGGSLDAMVQKSPYTTLDIHCMAMATLPRRQLAAQRCLEVKGTMSQVRVHHVTDTPSNTSITEMSCMIS
jgi:hypothetical protein